MMDEDKGDNDGDMNPEAGDENYAAFALTCLMENPRKTSTRQLTNMIRSRTR